MAKIRLTKNELKKHKDSLKMFRRYLPTLMLKKQQLQGEVRLTDLRIMELHAERDLLNESFRAWIGVFTETGFFTPELLSIVSLRTGTGNVAGVSIPLFEGAEFAVAEYDLAGAPLWVDAAVERMRSVMLLDLEAEIVAEQKRRLENELRVTTQRVNLFEKVKIPETQRSIKKIQVYLGDQQTAAVVRGKIAKGRLEKAGA